MRKQYRSEIRDINARIATIWQNHSAAKWLINKEISALKKQLKRLESKKNRNWNDCSRAAARLLKRQQIIQGRLS